MGWIGENVTLDAPALVHETACLYGKVYVGPGASIWPTRAPAHRRHCASPCVPPISNAIRCWSY